MYYVYILFSELDKQLYTGFSDDLKTRYEKHQKGFVKATKHRRPLKLIYYESYANELDARRREIYLKGGNGKATLKIQLKEIFLEIEYKISKRQNQPSAHGVYRERKEKIFYRLA